MVVMTKIAFHTSSFFHKVEIGKQGTDRDFTSKTLLVVSDCSEWEANVMDETSTQKEKKIKKNLKKSTGLFVDSTIENLLTVDNSLYCSSTSAHNV